MSHRPDQVASLIRKAVQSVLDRGLNDPRVRGLISVTKVNLDDGLSHAVVCISVLPAEQADLTMHGLHHAAPAVRAQIARSVRLRHVPRITFQLDESIKKLARFEADLAESRVTRPSPDSEARAETEEYVP